MVSSATRPSRDDAVGLANPESPDHLVPTLNSGQCAYDSAPVDRQNGAGDVAGPVAREVQGGLGDVFWCALALERPE